MLVFLCFVSYETLLFWEMVAILTKEVQAILLSTFLFSRCTPDSLNQWSDQMNWTSITFKKGDVLLDSDHFQKKLGILLSGRILVTKQNMVVSELHKGDLFGAATLFNDEPHYVSTLTARTRCEVLFLSQAEVQELMRQSQLVQQNYVYYLSNRIRFLSNKIDTLIESTSREKLLSFLLQQMDSSGQITLPCSMTELASRLNIGRASLYREVQKLEKEDILRRSGKKILLNHPEMLQVEERN